MAHPVTLSVPYKRGGEWVQPGEWLTLPDDVLAEYREQGLVKAERDHALVRDGDGVKVVHADNAASMESQDVLARLDSKQARSLKGGK